MTLDTRFGMTVLEDGMIYDTNVDWANMKLLGDNAAHLHAPNTYDGGVQIVYGAVPASDTWGSGVSGDANLRFVVDADGTLHWGPGNAVSDVSLYRSAIGQLSTDGDFTVQGGDIWFGVGDVDTGQGHLWWDGPGDNISLGFDGGQGGIFRLYTAGTTGLPTLQVDAAGAITLGGVRYAWPAAIGGAGLFLSSDAAGNLSWAPVSVPVTGVAGTANQVVVTAAGSVYTVSLPSGGTLPGSWTAGSGLNVGGASSRITGDFSNAALINRVLFQTSTVNGPTWLGAIPNGSSQVAGHRAWASSNPTNAAYGAIWTDGALVYLDSGISGTGTYLPLVLLAGGAERMRVTPAGAIQLAAGARITSDFSTATFANRPMFQTSVVNNTTDVGVIPNGTSTQSSLTVWGSSALTNASYGQLEVDSGAVHLTAANIGTGALLPLAFGAGGAERMRITAAGLVGINMVPSSQFDVNGVIRTTGLGAVATTGVGVELDWSGTIGYVVAVNRGTGTYQPMHIAGTPCTMDYGGTTMVAVNGTGGVNVTGHVYTTGAVLTQGNTSGGGVFNTTISGPASNILYVLMGGSLNCALVAQGVGGSPSTSYWEVNPSTGTAGASQAHALQVNGFGQTMINTTGGSNAGKTAAGIFFPTGVAEKINYEADSPTSGFGVGLNANELCHFTGLTFAWRYLNLTGTRLLYLDSAGNSILAGTLAQSGSWRALKTNINPVAPQVADAALGWVRDTMEISRFGLKTDAPEMLPHIGIVFDHPHRPMPDDLREMITATPNGEVSLGDAWGFNLMLIQQLAREVQELREMLHK